MFKKVLLTIGLLLMANTVLFAQGTLKGKVTDAKSGDDMPFVNVIALQNGQQVGGGQTDFDGVYTIKALPVGKYDIKVSYVGYETHMRTGVDVKASGFTVIDVKLKPSATTLEVVEITEQKVPVIEIGTPESGSRLSSDDIAKMPGTSVESIVAAVGGVGYSDGGTSTARGEDNMVTMQGNVRKRTGVNVPKEAIAEIQVILGGTPASIGEAIGGTQIITLKPPSSSFNGIVKYETFLDYRNYNSLMVYLTGPLWKKKITLDGGGISERTMMGFRLTGQGYYIKDQYYRPREKRYQVVKDDVVNAIEQKPITYNPVTGEIGYTAETQLHKEDFVEIKQKPNLQYAKIALEGAIDIRFSDYATLQITGEYGFTKAPNTNSAYWPLNLSTSGNGVSEAQNLVLTVDFTKRFKDEEPSGEATTPEAKTAAPISNVMINVTGMYNRYTSKSYNEMFGGSLNDVFKYGHIGQFTTEKDPTYQLVSDYNYDGVVRPAFVQDNWRDVVTYNGGSQYNPVLANYNNQLFDPEGDMQDLIPFMTTIDYIRGFRGLLNGDAPSTIYGRIYNVGTQATDFAYSEQDFLYFQAKASALIKGHDIELGFQYDRSWESYYQLGAYKLWTLMRQNANRHILQMNTSAPIYEWRGSDLYVSYPRLVNESQQTMFDASMRDWLQNQTEFDLPSVGASDWLDVDRYTPEQFAAAGGVNMFSAEELFNNGNQYVNYYGYDHTGKKYNGKNWNLDKFFNADKDGYQYLPAFSPIYMAGYIQDKFWFQDLIFNVGVRVDYFDGNQPVLKDPYLLYESYTVGDVASGITAIAPDDLYEGAGDDWVVYVDNVDYTSGATAPTIKGYRNKGVWYDANGVEVSTPSDIAGKSGKPTPYRTKEGQTAAENNTVNSNAFEDYKPVIVPMPRIAFSFPVGDNSQFKASYDIIARRPSGGWQGDYLSYLYMSQASGFLNNPNLQPERITNYELGFQQALNQTSAIGITAYYKETRDLIQICQYAGADPNQNYYSYDNLDFKTIKGFTLSYDLRQTKNIRINANYTLQYAEGTGLSSTTMTELIKEGYTTLKMLCPISDDRRHEFKANVDFRYFGGSKYNGPVITRAKKDKETGETRKEEVKILENFGINFMAVAQSGRPYTKAFSNMQSTIVGGYRGARMPWGFYFNIVADKTWPIHVGKRDTYINLALTINNLFDIRNVVGVFAVTGNAEDNGYLTDPETQATINAYLDPQAFRDLYTVTYLGNSVWNYSSPRTFRVSLSYNF